MRMFAALLGFCLLTLDAAEQLGMRGMVVLMLLLWFGGPILTAPLNWLFRIALSIKDLLVLA